LQWTPSRVTMWAIRSERRSPVDWAGPRCRVRGSVAGREEADSVSPRPHRLAATHFPAER